VAVKAQVLLKAYGQNEERPQKVVEKALITQYPDESQGRWVDKETAMTILDKTSAALDTAVSRAKAANRPITNHHMKDTMNQYRLLYFVTHEQFEKFQEDELEIRQQEEVEREEERIGAIAERVVKENVRIRPQSVSASKDPWANQLQSEYLRQISKAEATIAELTQDNKRLNTALLEETKKGNAALVEATKKGQKALEVAKDKAQTSLIEAINKNAAAIVQATKQHEQEMIKLYKELNAETMKLSRENAEYRESLGAAEAKAEKYDEIAMLLKKLGG